MVLYRYTAIKIQLHSNCQSVCARSPFFLSLHLSLQDNTRLCQRLACFSFHPRRELCLWSPSGLFLSLSCNLLSPLTQLTYTPMLLDGCLSLKEMSGYFKRQPINHFLKNVSPRILNVYNNVSRLLETNFCQLTKQSLQAVDSVAVLQHLMISHDLHQQWDLFPFLLSTLKTSHWSCVSKIPLYFGNSGRYLLMKIVWYDQKLQNKNNVLWNCFVDSCFEGHTLAFLPRVGWNERCPLNVKL